MTAPILADIPEWKQFLKLGEELLTQPHTAAQTRLIEERVKKLLGCQAKVWLAEPYYPLPGEPPVQTLPHKKASTLVQRAYSTRELVCQIDRKQESACNESEKPRYIALPIITQENVLGVIEVERKQGSPFRQDELNFLEGLASHAAVSMQISRQVTLKNWRYEQLVLVGLVSSQIANLPETSQLCKRVVKLIQETFHYYCVSIFTVDGDLDLILRAITGEGIRSGEEPILRLKFGEGLVGSSAQIGQEILARDVQEDTRYQFNHTLPETRSEIAIPLKIEGRILGVLDVQSDQLDAFHDMDMMVLRMLADNIALAFEGSRLYQHLQHRADQLSAVFEISHVLTSILNYDQLLDEVVALIHKRFGYPYVHLFTVHSGRRRIFFRAGSGQRSQAAREIELSFDLDNPVGIISLVARTGQSRLVSDTNQEPLYQASSLPPSDTRSELCIPLKVGDDVVGILDLQSEQGDAFHIDDQFVLESLAASVAISMRNASLYGSEQWRRQVADSFRGVAGLISANVALDQLLDTVLSELEKNLPCEVSAIWLLDEPYIDYGEENRILRLAAAHGISKEEIILAREESDVVRNWLDNSLSSPDPLIRRPGDPHGPLGSAMQFADDYSSIAAPLRAGDQVLGVLTLAHHTTGRYGSEARSMTATFANYAAVAIQNSRLYAAAQDQAWTSTVLLQVSEATQAVETQDELFSTMARLAPLLVGVQKSAFFLWDDAQAAFMMKAWYGFDMPADRSLLFDISIPVFANLVADHNLIFVEDAVADLNLPEATVTSPGGTLLILPLMARGEILGAFLVAHQTTGNIGAEHPFNDQTLAILQGIAQQTSVALENIHLLESRQEEAYVTAVLLQVAQAVVSQNELSDILDTVVHLMPILVGIDSCVIYLWDSSKQAFIPGQAFTGTKAEERQLMEKSYPAGNYPLLDKVRNSDTMIVSAIGDEWSRPENWSEILVSDMDGATQVEKKGDWLMASPLSVKGEVFGVLLAHESAVAESIHQKRLEIITGVAQQIALAIQNEKLNQEMVGRERLEREFQLARQIQKTFLPNHLPEPAGWQFGKTWQTAREVGGDFYDVFKIDGDHLGIVVADVADKGMPAALYMTVTRTLLRANAQNHRSPARVLERVNNLLLVDSQNGMFVTAVYAILTLSTGKLLYANAGHNRPLLVHANGEVVTLPKGELALGVLEGIKHTDNEIAIQPGDALLFYTDGATESFSTNGEAFGEERLQAAVGDHPVTTAVELLERVEAALADFRGGAPPSDDLTLVAVYRQIIKNEKVE